jgi:hypothetical protein
LWFGCNVKEKYGNHDEGARGFYGVFPPLVAAGPSLHDDGGGRNDGKEPV